MRKIIVMITFLSIVISGVNAQNIARNAIGLRLGDNDGFGSEISYQHELVQNTRLEVDLGFRNHTSYDAFKLSGLHQWVWNIDDRFNWYAGFGAGIGSWSAGTDYTGSGDDGLFLNADGNIGVEYDFEIPLLMSLDFRPEIGILGDYGKSTDIDVALSVRYQF
jgi:hypothetical protein